MSSAKAAEGLDDVWDDWRSAVNMSPDQLEESLGSD